MSILILYWQFNKETSSLAFSFGFGPDLAVMGSDNMASDIDADAPAYAMIDIYIKLNKCYTSLGFRKVLEPSK